MTSPKENGPLSPQEAAIRVQASLKNRARSERRFRYLGITAITLSILFLVLLFVDRGVCVRIWVRVHAQ